MFPPRFHLTMLDYFSTNPMSTVCQAHAGCHRQFLRHQGREGSSARRGRWPSPRTSSGFIWWWWLWPGTSSAGCTLQCTPFRLCSQLVQPAARLSPTTAAAATATASLPGCQPRSSRVWSTPTLWIWWASPRWSRRLSAVGRIWTGAAPSSVLKGSEGLT